LLHSQSWVQIPDFPGSQRDDGCVFTIGNKAYCFTGNNGSACELNGFVYDGVSNTWGNMANLPIGKERQYATAFSYSNNGYMLTGITCPGVCLNDMYKYEEGTNTWAAMPNFPGQVRQGACNFVIGDKAYIISGRNSSGNVFNDVWEYNITGSTWTQKNNLPFAGMFRGTAFQINGIGYVCYGLTNNNNFNRYIYKYDHLNDAWQMITAINLPAKNYVACAVTSNKAFLYGGQDSVYNITNDMSLFDPTNNSVITYSGIPTLGRKGGMAFSLNNIFYITTGVDSSPARIKETWKNDQFVGIESNYLNAPLVDLYPNPTNNFITVKGNNLASLTILNSLGEIVLSQELYSNENMINLTQLPSSIYSVSVVTRSTIVQKKIVVQR